MEKPIIIFDGICNLCNRSVQIVIKNDPAGKFMFASLQSEKGQQLLKKFNLPLNEFNSFILVKDDKVYTKSTGALKVAKQLKGGWWLLYGFIIVPKFIRDAVYNWVARNRYKWFGKREECMLPTPAIKARFIEYGK
jgi:predicted DCC family thiol-disulfide oxidoreductase YuxK